MALTLLRHLPEESLVSVLESVDAQSLSELRRSCRLLGGPCSCEVSDLAQEARVAELRARALELLEVTKFPFTHASYVLGLNGRYYSLDTIAERHYGIPKKLPEILCQLFRLAVPGVPFTTMRIQKLSAAANFGGHHKTLAFNLSTPVDEEAEDSEGAESDVNCRNREALDKPTRAHSSLGYVLCLTRGCTGGWGESCEDPSTGEWSWLTGSKVRRRWAAFPGKAWLRWHWPSSGDLFIVTVSCESPENLRLLRRRDRCQMASLGFVLPGSACARTLLEEEEDEEEVNTVEEPPVAAAEVARPPRAARLVAARGLLGLTGVVAPSLHEVEEAFRKAARAAHPDRRGGGNQENQSSWVMARLQWARRVLREALGAAAAEPAGEDEDVEILALPAPQPQDVS